MVSQRISVAELHNLPRLNAHARPLAGGLALAVPYRYGGRVRGGIDVESVVASLQDRESLIRGVNFVDFPIEQMPHVQIHRALMQGQLHRVVADIGQRQAGLGTYPDQSSSNIQFGSRTLVRPNVVRDGQRTIHRTLHPFISAVRLNGNWSWKVLKTRGAAGNILLLSISVGAVLVRNLHRLVVRIRLIGDFFLRLSRGILWLRRAWSLRLRILGLHWLGLRRLRHFVNWRAVLLLLLRRVVLLRRSG
jgi:hypothetical protein